MNGWTHLVASLILSASPGGFGGPQPPGPAPVPLPIPVAVPVEDVPPPNPATSRIVAATVYRDSALVTREVVVPAGKGTVELVVTPLPGATMANSLYTEGSEGFRVLSTRFRARAVREDTRLAVREKEAEVAELGQEAGRLAKEIEVLGQNLDFLTKLETFTGATMQGVAEKGMLNGDATIKLTTFVMETRAEKSSALVAAEQKLRGNAEAAQFARRQLKDLAAGSSRTENDAVIVVEKANAPAGSVRLNYLVGASTWKPQYRLRAGAEKDPVQLEYLAAIEQRSGEDWADAAITLSTAQPSFSATLPELVALDIAIIPNEDEGVLKFDKSEGGMTVEENRAQAGVYRGQAQRAIIGNDARAGGALLNEAAALDQAEELLAKDDEKEKGEAGPGDGPSVTHRLKGRLSVPSRRDPQLVEVARVEMAPEYFAKAVPVLTPRVYRLAKLTNTGDSVILPGEATMFVGTDFVGRMTLPQVAVGEPFIVGFGVDPQLQIGRRLVRKSEVVQGGNQVHTYEFRIVVRNYKSTPANIQVWDRLPRGENNDVAVNLVEAKPDLSVDVLYARNQRPENLLRWDVVVPVGTVGEKVFPVTYAFRLEYAKEMGVRYLKSSGIMEAPIGGMGGMGGGGMRGTGGFQ